MALLAVGHVCATPHARGDEIIGGSDWQELDPSILQRQLEQFQTNELMLPAPSGSFGGDPGQSSPAFSEPIFLGPLHPPGTQTTPGGQLVQPGVPNLTAPSQQAAPSYPDLQRELESLLQLDGPQPNPGLTTEGYGRLRETLHSVSPSLPIDRIMGELVQDAHTAVQPGIAIPGGLSPYPAVSALEQALASADADAVFLGRYQALIGANGRPLAPDALSLEDLVGGLQIFRVVGIPSAGPALEQEEAIARGLPVAFAVDEQEPTRTITLDASAPIVSPRLGLFASVGIIVQRRDLVLENGMYRLEEGSYRTDGRLRMAGVQEALPICARDAQGQEVLSIMSRYTAAPRYTGRACSGFLAQDQRTFVTARHCVLSAEQMRRLANNGFDGCLSDTTSGRAALSEEEIDEDYLSELAVLFGFKVDQFGRFPTTFERDQVYFVNNIIEVEEAADAVQIVLDAPVPETVAEPLPIDQELRTDWFAMQDRHLVFISHSLGLPQVLDYQSVGVLRPQGNDSFSLLASADSYAGGSGGPLFDFRSGTVVGILICGAEDYAVRSSFDAGNRACLMPRITREASQSTQTFLHLNSVLQ
jgi:hypothetical protein